MRACLTCVSIALGALLAAAGGSRAQETAAGGCPEAGRFYPPDTLAKVYSGTAASLRLDHTALLQGFSEAVRRYETGGGALTAAEGDLPQLWAVLPRSPSPTGREEELRRLAAEARKEGGKPLTPGDFFFLALKAAGGRIGEALRAAHACVAPDESGANAAFIRDHLAPLRNPEGYKEEPLLGGRDSRGNLLLRSARDTLGLDETGAWSTLIGMAALGLADGTGAAPLAVTREAAAQEDGDLAAARARLAASAEPRGIEEALAAYGTTLGGAIRGARRRVPDPDRACLGFAGLAAGRALREKLRLPVPPAEELRLTPASLVAEAEYALLVRSPASVRLTGEDGERLEWDAGATRLTGNTAAALLDLLPGASGGGLVVTPLFRVRRAEVTAAREGSVNAAIYRYRDGRAEARPLTVAAGRWAELVGALSARNNGSREPTLPDKPTDPNKPDEPEKPRKPAEPLVLGEFTDETGTLKPEQAERIAAAVGALKAKAFPVGFAFSGELEQGEAEERATRFRDRLIRDRKLTEEGGVFLFYRTGNLYRIQWLRTQSLEDRLPGDAVTRLWKRAAEEKDPVVVAVRFLELLADALR